MAQHFNFPNFRVTETQRLIAVKALAVLGINAQDDDFLIEDFTRAMVIIQEAGMQSYFARGLKWSFISRSEQEQEQVEGERAALRDAVEYFSGTIDTARGKAACRIRANRARRARQYEEELALEIEERRYNLTALEEHRAAVRQAAQYNPNLAA